MTTTIFEYTNKFDEATYLAIWSSKSTRWVRFCIICVAGLIMLFWSYTLVLGSLLLLLCVLKLISPQIVSKGLHHNFQRHKYLHQLLTYGISQERLWVRGATLDASTTWPLLVTWQIIRGWLVLTFSGIPQLFFPVCKLEDAGVFEQVLKLAKQYGTEFK
jgi:hypothetical protein